MKLHEFIDFKAAIAQMDIHRQAHEARRTISRMAHFPARSAGQKRRFNKEAQKQVS
ncbi:MAG TPA: hypothetical protein VK149_12105 [Sideroxyarcus sp.]|nr:hypothetical protein [Sideroxyarcus sp.]